MFKRILFADDGSGRIEGAFSAATALAAREHAQIILIHVSPEDAPVQGEVEISANLRSRVEALRAAGLSAESHMKFGHPADKLADAALASDADLLIISPQHHSILQSLRHPSVTARIIGQATVPVLIWPQQLPGTAFDDLLQVRLEGHCFKGSRWLAATGQRTLRMETAWSCGGIHDV